MATYDTFKSKNHQELDQTQYDSKALETFYTELWLK